MSSACVGAGMNHYLFCAAWNDTGLGFSPPCEDPIENAKDVANHVIKELEAFGPIFLKDINNLKIVVADLTEINNCQDTSTTYDSAKHVLCWEVNNVAMRVTLMYILNWPILFAFLIYLFFSWYRFNLQHVPYDAFYKDGVPPEMEELALAADDDQVPLDSQSAQEELVLLDSEPESVEDLETDHSKIKKKKMHHMLQARALALLQESHQTCKKYLSAVIYTTALFTVLLVTTIVWLAMQTQFEHVQHYAC